MRWTPGQGARLAALLRQIRLLLEILLRKHVYRLVLIV